MLQAAMQEMHRNMQTLQVQLHRQRNHMQVMQMHQVKVQLDLRAKLLQLSQM